MQRLYRNNITRFSKNPVNIDIPRTRFNMPHKHTTTFNSGKLIPMFIQECLPGDTFQMDTSIIARMSTPEFPVMDTAYLDYYYFFVPNRLVWDNFREFMGENSNGAWTTNKVERRIPVFETTAPSKSNSDYFGLPTLLGNNAKLQISALPYRALRLIWNDYFRSTALQDPLLINTGDTEPEYTVGLGNDDLLPVCRFPDFFSTCLPAPQYGEPVQIGLIGGEIPVYSQSKTHTRNSDGVMVENNGSVSMIDSFVGLHVEPNGDSDYPDSVYLRQGIITDGSGNDFVFNPLNNEGDPTQFNLMFNNLWSNTSDAVWTSVNDLRLAFQVQKYQEALARGGTRYTEIILSLFNVTSPDARLQRPEYLGGSRAIINMGQVIQTSESASTPQGNVSGFSKTVARSSDFTYSIIINQNLIPPLGTVLGIFTTLLDRAVVRKI